MAGLSMVESCLTTRWSGPGMRPQMRSQMPNAILFFRELIRAVGQCGRQDICLLHIEW